MRSGSWFGATSTDNVRVTVNGTVRPVQSVKIQSGMRDGHPQSETGSSWCVEATIVWVAPPLVFSAAPHPFGVGTEWLPKAGDSVVVETGDGALGKWWVQHRGVVDDTTGSFADGTATSKTIDTIDDLSAAVQFGALLEHMPPAGDGFPLRHMGMQSTFLVDRTMRTVQGDAGGWHATPPRTWQTVGSAPNQGSLWPEVGSLITASSNNNANASPAWSRTDYGVAPVYYSADYYLIEKSRSPVFTCAIGPARTGDGRGEFYLRDGDGGHGFFVGFNAATDEITYGTLTPGRTTFTLPRQGSRRVAVYFQKNPGDSQTLILRTDDGRQVQKDLAMTGFPAAWGADRVSVDASARLGWWIAENNKPVSQRWSTLNFTPTARIRVGSSMPWWRATRDMPYEDAADWLAQQVDAECASMWLDEDGVMQWAGRGVLEDQPTATTVTSVRDVDDVRWEQRRSAMARGVWLNYDDARPKVRRSDGARVQTCWGSSNVDVGRGPDEGEIVNVSVPEDEDWISVDLNPHHVKGGSTLRSFFEGSTFGGTQYRASDANEQSWALFLDCTMSREGLRNFVIDFAAWSTIAYGHRVKTTFPKVENALMGPLVDETLNLRARAITTWVKGERSAMAGAIGPARFTRDVGWRVQQVGDAGSGTDNISDLLAFLRAAVMSTRPRVTGLTMAHDPRLQIGDKIRVEDQHVTGLYIVMLVQDRTTDTDDFTDTISGRVIDAYALQELTANGPRDRYDLHEPAGSTPVTPESNWNREVV